MVTMDLWFQCNPHPCYPCYPCHLPCQASKLAPVMKGTLYLDIFLDVSITQTLALLNPPRTSIPVGFNIWQNTLNSICIMNICKHRPPTPPPPLRRVFIPKSQNHCWWHLIHPPNAGCFCKKQCFCRWGRVYDPLNMHEDITTKSSQYHRRMDYTALLVGNFNSHQAWSCLWLANKCFTEIEADNFAINYETMWYSDSSKHLLIVLWTYWTLLHNEEQWTQKTLRLSIEPLLVYCWPTVCDVGPTLSQHWIKEDCLQGEVSAQTTLSLLSECWFNVGPPSATLAQQYTNNSKNSVSLEVDDRATVVWWRATHPTH